MDDIKLYLNKYEKDINKINVIRKLQNKSKLFNIEFTFTNNKIIKFFEDDNIYKYCQIIISEKNLAVTYKVFMSI